jgi:hypothetical protein
MVAKSYGIGFAVEEIVDVRSHCTILFFWS